MTAPTALARRVAPPEGPAAPAAHPRRRPCTARAADRLSLVMTYLSVIVLIPLAAVVWRSQSDGLSGFLHAITTPEASSTLKLTIVSSFAPSPRSTW
jgi:sulfate transport system permease protein